MSRVLDHPGRGSRSNELKTFNVVGEHNSDLEVNQSLCALDILLGDSVNYGK